MDKLWRKRKPPVPLDWESIKKGKEINSGSGSCTYLYSYKS